MKLYFYFVSFNAVDKQGNIIFPGRCEFVRKEEIKSIKDIDEIERTINKEVELKQKTHIIVLNYQLLRIEEE